MAKRKSFKQKQLTLWIDRSELNTKSAQSFIGSCKTSPESAYTKKLGCFDNWKTYTIHVNILTLYYLMLLISSALIKMLS
jgi:hypothetical protein